MKRVSVLSLVPILLWAGTTGKLAGVVKDAETDEPLPLANVVIVETNMGTSTDENGTYFILNIPPGFYRVKASYMGYQTVVMENVRIEADRTTFLDFRLRQAPLEVEEIVVTAERPLIEKDATWKVAPVRGEEIRNLPVTSALDIISLQGGVTEGISGELHLRGGREDEILYLVDGLPVKNPLFGGFGGYIERNAVNELTLLAGTFSAEYGEALSGIVNIVTREGGDNYTAGIELLSGYLYFFKDPVSRKFVLSTSSLYRRPDWFKENGDVHRDSLTNTSLYEPQKIRREFNLPMRGEVRGYFGGPLPGYRKLKFFLSGVYRNEESYLPFGYDLLSNVQGKITHSITPSLKLEGSFERTWKRYQGYNHKWKYHYDHYPETKSVFTRGSLTLRHLLSKSTFYTLTFGVIFEAETLKVRGKMSYDEYEEPKTDDCTEFFLRGDALKYRRSYTNSYILKSIFTHQRGHHEIKAGIEGKVHRIRVNGVERLYVFGYIGDDQYESYEREFYEGSLFLQDKIEFPSIVLNAGLRFDFLDPNTEMWEDPEEPGEELVKVPPRTQISPRLGVAYPVFENAVLHFSYGHFFQAPSANALYTHPQYLDPDSLPAELAILGNPALKPQKTVAYEVGVALSLFNEYSFDFTLYAKDIWDLLTIKNIRTYPYDYNIYYNEDFATVRGFDITLRRPLRDKFGFSISYTYQVARGNRSFPLQGFYDAYTGKVETKKEVYLDFDRRHDLALSMESRLPFDIYLGILAELASGLPYTPYVALGVVVEENSARMPYTFTMDILMRKRLNLYGVPVEFLFEAKNIFDRRNVRYVYPRTGDPWDPGEWGLGMCSEDYAKNPAHVGPPRRFRLGLRIGK
jgi:outer membrane receptor protein involved in Fe transport